jgi:benzylsuccinate CoA-transferase BbsE subunit
MQSNLGPLAGIRVLDLAGGAEQYCGKLFAQLGADVLLVEPTAGCAQRREGPFFDERAHPEMSLSFAYFNQGKRGLAIDLDSGAGQDLLRRLASRADLVIECERPGLMASRGIDARRLAEMNQALVVTSITPFGQEGPYAQFEGGDLVTLAFGGLLSLGGYPGLAPTAPYGNQAVLSAAQFAAVASMMALWEVEGQTESRTGQHVDVSIQESVAMALENAVQFVELEGSIRQRNGGEQRQAGTGVFPCSDGMVYLMAGGVASNKFWKATANWLVETGAAGAEELLDGRWLDQAFLQTTEAKRIFAGVFCPYAAPRTKAELYEEGQRRRIPICPVSTTADLLQNRQLMYRRFFEETVHPYTGRSISVPGAPYRFSASPWTLGRPAPRLGEHTHQVLSELGLSNEQQTVLLRQGLVA